jgi:hypothetical protein
MRLLLSPNRPKMRPQRGRGRSVRKNWHTQPRPLIHRAGASVENLNSKKMVIEATQDPCARPARDIVPIALAEGIPWKARRLILRLTPPFANFQSAANGWPGNLRLTILPGSPITYGLAAISYSEKPRSHYNIENKPQRTC